MEAVIIAILIVFAICMLFWRILKAILKPIFVYLYESAIKGLGRLGMSRQAAMALISAIIVLVIVLALL